MVLVIGNGPNTSSPVYVRCGQCIYFWLRGRLCRQSERQGQGPGCSVRGAGCRICWCFLHPYLGMIVSKYRGSIAIPTSYSSRCARREIEVGTGVSKGVGFQLGRGVAPLADSRVALVEGEVEAVAAFAVTLW